MSRAGSPRRVGRARPVARLPPMTAPTVSSRRLRLPVAALVLLAAAGRAAAAELPPLEVVEASAGRVHPMLVHFPIALLLVAGVVELFRFVTRREQPSALAFGCLVFGALGAAAAAGSGWLYAEHDPPGRRVAELLEWHRWTAVVCAAAALLAIPAALLRRGAEGGARVWIYRVLISVAVVGAGGAGHLGGELVYGEGYALEPLADHYDWGETGADEARDEDVPDPDARLDDALAGDDTGDAGAPDPDDLLGGALAGLGDGPPDADAPVDDASRDAVDGVPAEPVTLEFVAHVQPILEARCFGCHGPEKQKGRLRLDRPEEIWGDDAEDWVVVPGDAAASAVYERITLPPDDIDVMPPEDEGEPLTAEQIALIGAWIEGGARWDGVEVPAPAGD